MPSYPLPGEQIPIVTGPNGEPIVPIDGSTPPLSPVAPVTPPKKTPGRLLFDKFNAGETQFTSLRYTDARDGFNKQMAPKTPYQLFPPTGYIGIAPNEKQAASNHGVRISDFLKTPRGQKFIDKQVGLQLSNTRLESLDLFSTTANNITKKLGFGSLGDSLGGIGNISISPSTILSAINTIKDIQNNGPNEKNLLSAVGVVARKQTRSGISALQNYNFQNTIDQAGTDPNTGWNHYDRFGASNIMSDNDKYWYIVRENNGSEDLFPTDSPSNRLVKLRNNLGTGTASTDAITELADKITTGKFGLKAIRRFTNNVNSYYNQGLGLFNALGNNNQSRDFQPINNAISDVFNFANNRLAIADQFIAPFTTNIIDQYEGGPNSLNGVGPTIIKRYDNTNDSTRIRKINNIRDNKLSELRNLLFGEAGGESFGPTVISQQYQQDTGEDLFKDIKREVANNVYKHGKSPNYETIRQTNLPKPKKSYRGWTADEKTKIYKYKHSIHTSIDVPINKDTTTNQYFNKYGKFQEFNRFVPRTDKQIEKYNKGVHRVIFTPIDPFTGKPFGVIPEIDGRLRFDAYISNFKDNFTPTWNDINYIGRSETFHTFSKFKRDVSFTLQVPCFNPIQLRNRHRALYELASINAGSYNQGKLGGVITYLRLGNYLNSKGNYEGEPGIITNFSITVPNDASWDVDSQLAHYLTVDIGFKLIHNTRPSRTSGGFIGANIGEYLLNYKDDLNETYDDVDERAARNENNGRLGSSILNKYTNVTGEDALKQFNDEQDFQKTAFGQSINQQYGSITGDDAVTQYNNEQEFQRQAANQALGKKIQNSIYNMTEDDLTAQGDSLQFPTSDDWRGEPGPDPPSFFQSDDGYGGL
jgi:hypothetical protein